MSNEDKVKELTAAIEKFISDFERWEISKPFMTSRSQEVNNLLHDLAKTIEPIFMPRRKGNE